MILDKYIPYSYKVLISIFAAGFWIYFRTQECYAMVTSHNLFPVIFVMIWVYLNYLDPLFLPIGLVILLIYSFRSKIFQIAI